MLETEQLRMQRLAAQPAHRRRRIRPRRAPPGLADAAAIGRIAHHRMAAMGQVDADLVGASGLQPAADPGCGGAVGGAEQGGDLVVGDGLAPAGAGRARLFPPVFHRSAGRLATIEA